MEGENKGSAFDDFISGLDLDGFEGEKLPDKSDKEYSPKPEGTEQVGPRDVTVKFYKNDTASTLITMVYQTRHGYMAEAYNPDSNTHRMTKESKFQDISDFAGFVKDLFGQIEYRCDVPINEDVHDMGPIDDWSKLSMNEYEVGKTLELQRKFGQELSGIIDFMQGKYNPKQGL